MIADDATARKASLQSITAATYEGVCDDCGSPIRVGQAIQREPMYGKWVHAKCPVVEICGECFTQKSVTGSCMCPEVA